MYYYISPTAAIAGEMCEWMNLPPVITGNPQGSMIRIHNTQLIAVLVVFREDVVLLRQPFHYSATVKVGFIFTIITQILMQEIRLLN